MTNKQTQPLEAEPMSASLLLRSWNKTLEIVEQARKVNRESGERDPDQYVVE
jgi:hypothetical protein